MNCRQKQEFTSKVPGFYRPSNKHIISSEHSKKMFEVRGFDDDIAYLLVI